MVVVSGTTLGGGYSKVYRWVLQQKKWKSTQVVQKKRTSYRRGEKRFLVGKGVLSQVSAQWKTLSPEQKQWWRECALHSDMGVYQYFSQEQSYRIKHGIPSIKVPNKQYQYKLGHLALPSNGAMVMYAQTGNETPQSMWEVGCNIKSALIEQDSDEWLRELEIRGWYLNNSVVTPWACVLEIPESQNWGFIWKTKSNMPNMLSAWELTLTVKGYSGDLWFDNLYATDFYDVMNYDFRCENVEKNWKPIIVPTGTTLETIYLSS